MKTILVFLLIAGFISGCTSTTNISENIEVDVEKNGNINEGYDLNNTEITDFSEVVGHELRLTEVYVNGTKTQYNREALSDIFSEAFILKFDEQRFSGRGAPNLIVATPYTLGENQSINIGLIPTTLMAAIFEPDHLKEHDFFKYIQSAYSWRITGGNLELYSRFEDNNEIKLVFLLS